MGLPALGAGFNQVQEVFQLIGETAWPHPLNQGRRGMVFKNPPQQRQSAQAISRRFLLQQRQSEIDLLREVNSEINAGLYLNFHCMMLLMLKA